jgi:hypothetical protein
MQSDDDEISANSLEWDGSRKPPIFPYHTYPSSEDIMDPLYAQSYRSISSSGNWTKADPHYLSPVSIMPPSKMQFHHSVKRENEDTLTPFNMTYPRLQAVDIHAHHGYNDSNPHVWHE